MRVRDTELISPACVYNYFESGCPFVLHVYTTILNLAVLLFYVFENVNRTIVFEYVTSTIILHIKQIHLIY